MVFPRLNHGFLANDQLVFSRRVLKVDVSNLLPLVCCVCLSCFCSLLLADGALVLFEMVTAMGHSEVPARSSQGEPCQNSGGVLAKQRVIKVMGFQCLVLHGKRGSRSKSYKCS